MQPTLDCFGVGVVLFLLAPLTGSFSRGANQASCQEMTPGHISAQPLYLQHSHVTLHTSASSYLPGQLLTVTVRSSRDFMGFLLQARSSTRVGPVLVGGSWTFTPPGTHTLHCFSEGDTLTHSDKQLKRNLSFVWRAPDAPMGDIRFYITVVQSYFVYWAGIESAVVHDGSQSNTPSFALQGEEVTDLPDESTLHLSSSTFTHSLLTSSLVQHNSTTALHPYNGSTQVSIRPSIMSLLFTHLSSSSMKTAPAISVLSAPSPISTPPSSSASSTTPSSNYSTHPSPDPLFSPVTLSPSSPFMSSTSITGSTFSSPSSSTISPVLSSFSTVSPVSSISSSNSPISSPLSSSISTSTPSSFFSPDLSRSTNSSIPSSSFMSFDSTTPYPGPSPAPRRSLYNPLMSSSSPVSSQRLTAGQRSLIQNHMTSSNPVPNLNPPTPKTAVHTNPEPHPNFKLNIGHELKPNLPNTKNKPKRPSNLPGTPDKEEKYPDIIPRHSAWELGMLLGSSAGLGMVLVVGVRYMYRQVCRKQTEMTLNDRERDYGRGERGLIHVQECGDLVRVRRIRENSFVLLAEYDILATPGD
ncbi:reelin domain-containing protein 1 [Mastacembelus armatus]|uniref:reelin domain-containing protein 1 n=1 Tax=Mastacembelus armatus TaxID=205130 RepID=UPI000E45942F|nr:reelin domain-containing protein 1 [Mastacembelus armatus]